MIDPSLLSMADWMCCEGETDVTAPSFRRHDPGTDFFHHGKSSTREMRFSLLENVKRAAASPDRQLA